MCNQNIDGIRNPGASFRQFGLIGENRMLPEQWHPGRAVKYSAVVLPNLVFQVSGMFERLTRKTPAFLEQAIVISPDAEGEVELLL